MGVGAKLRVWRILSGLTPPCIYQSGPICAFRCRLSIRMSHYWVLCRSGGGGGGGGRGVGARASGCP